MTSLDELFGEALTRETLDVASEVCARVGDVAVRGAKRRRRVRAAAEAVGVLAVVVLGVAVGSSVFGQPTTPALPLPQPTAVETMPAPNPSAPVSDLKADPRMPQAPAMTEQDWTSVINQWDVELASFANGGRDGVGSTVAVYFTPPEGTRLLAYTTTNFPLARPILLSFVASDLTGVVYDDATHKLYSLTLPAGSINELQIRDGQQLRGAYPLGKTPSGESFYVLETTPSLDGDAIDEHVFRHGAGVSEEVPITGTVPSPLWGTSIVTSTDDGLDVYDVESGSSTHIDGTDACSFEVWNRDGTFTASCHYGQDSTGDYYTIDPASGAMTLVWEDTAYEEAGDLDAITALTDSNAIDALRSWSGRATSGLDLRPPTVTGLDRGDIDLWEDFTNIPDSYAVIFGAHS